MVSFSSLKSGFHSYTRTCLVLSRSLVPSMLPKIIGRNARIPMTPFSSSQRHEPWKSLLVENQVFLGTLLALGLASPSTLLASLQHNLWIWVSQGSVLRALSPRGSSSSLGTLKTACGLGPQAHKRVCPVHFPRGLRPLYSAAALLRSSDGSALSLSAHTVPPQIFPVLACSAIPHWVLCARNLRFILQFFCHIYIQSIRKPCRSYLHNMTANMSLSFCVHYH